MRDQDRPAEDQDFFREIRTADQLREISRQRPAPPSLAGLLLLLLAKTTKIRPDVVCSRLVYVFRPSAILHVKLERSLFAIR